MHSAFYVAITNLLLSFITPVQANQAGFQTRVQESWMVVGEKVSLTVTKADFGNPCGVEIRFGDGQIQSLRIGDKSSEERVLHSYKQPGEYLIEVNGKTQFRGLNTAFACPGELKTVKVTVGDVAKTINTDAAAVNRDNTSQVVIPPVTRIGRKVALVVGNSDYLGEKRLSNPVNDAELIADTLRKLNFEVSVLRNANRLALLESLEDFERQSTGADASLFYFSGHGVQDSSKKNYLIPVDARIKGETSVQAHGVEAGFVVAALARAAPRVGLVLLDACRDNPFPTWQKNSHKGLARMDVQTIGDTEILVHFATRSGEIADDGSGKIGPYAQALARQLPFAGRQSIRLLLDNIGDDVRRTTSGKQRPEQFGEMRTSSFLVAREIGSSEAGSGAVPVPVIGQDELRWKTIVRSNLRSDFEAFLRQYPKSLYAELAQSRILQIDEQYRIEVMRIDQQAWLRADLSGTESAYLSYLSSFPSGSFVEQSKERIRLLRERQGKVIAAQMAEEVSRIDSAAWQKAEQTNTIPSYRLYLSNYPSGQFKNLALARIRILEDGIRIQNQQAQIPTQQSNPTTTSPIAEKIPGILIDVLRGISANSGKANTQSSSTDPLSGRDCPSGFRMIDGRWVCMDR